MSEQNKPGAIGNRGNEQITRDAAKQNSGTGGAYRIAGKQVTREAYFAWVNGKNAGK
jgi:hypothetical protein